MILDEILEHKRKEVDLARQQTPLAEIRARGAEQTTALDFASALQGEGVSLIAEVKKASPSKGVLRSNFDPLSLATIYAAHGAAAISVLTDARFFQGNLQILTAIRAALQKAGRVVPLLRKDFIIDPYQVYESRAAGADALLLIGAALSDEALAELLALTHKLGMTALVEVHDEREVARVLPLRPRVVGINNRDLCDFSVDLTRFERLRRLLPDDLIAVAESGIQTAADVRRLAEAGADAVLVGEALVKASDVGEKVRELVGGKAS